MAHCSARAAADYTHVPAASTSFPKVDQGRLFGLVQDIRSGSLTLPDAMLVADIVSAYRGLIAASPGLRRAIVRALGGEVTP